MDKYIIAVLLCLSFGIIAAQPVLSCYDIQYTMEIDGNSPYLDEEVRVQGIVTGTGFGGNNFFIADSGGGPWSGLYVYDRYCQPNLGDLVQFSGTVSEYYNFTEISSISNFQVLSQNNPLPEASEISTGALAGYATAEPWESVLIRVNNAEVTAVPNTYQEFFVNDGSGDCQIDNAFFEADHAWNGIHTGLVFSSITGIVDFSYNSYAINPRDAADLLTDNLAISLHIPHLTAALDSQLTVPMQAHNISAEPGYTSYAFDLYYDPQILEYRNIVQTGTLSQGGTIDLQNSPGLLNVSFQCDNALSGTGDLLRLNFWANHTGVSELNLFDVFFGADHITHISNGSVTVNSNYNTLGDTLTVIQRPILNIPAIHSPGETMTITCLAPETATGFEAWLVHENKRVSLPLQSATMQGNPDRWFLQVIIPPVEVYELYDLEVNATGGIHDVSRNAVQIVPSRKTNYYFAHITDLHLPNRSYYPNPGYDTDSTSVVDFRAVMEDLKLIRPEFVLLTGDLLNEGELEGFENQYWYGWTQRLLTELDIPVYVSSGNHDIGGWNQTPPPSGSARRNWWRYFGWSWLDNTDESWPYHTQDYFFNYGNTLYMGMEAYINYDSFRTHIYGSDSFTDQQLMWLDSTIDAHPDQRKVLFHHFDFQEQLSLDDLGLDMALYGHIHSNSGSIGSYPYNLATRSVCDGNRAYRIVRVSEDSFSPLETIYAGSGGSNLRVNYIPANNAMSDSVLAVITNNQPIAFENALLKLKMPLSDSFYDVNGGILEQVDRTGNNNLCYVRVNLPANSTVNVSISSDTSANEDPELIPIPLQIKAIYPNPLRGQGRLEVQSDKAFKKVHLELFNLRGQKVRDLEYHDIKQGLNLLDLKLELSSGVYLFRVKGMPGKAYKVVFIK